MANRTATKLIEVEGDVIIWTCDRCGKEEEVPSRVAPFHGSPPDEWVSITIRDGTAVQYKDHADLCSTPCATMWLGIRRAKYVSA